MQIRSKVQMTKLLQNLKDEILVYILKEVDYCMYYPEFLPPFPCLYFLCFSVAYGKSQWTWNNLGSMGMGKGCESFQC